MVFCFYVSVHTGSIPSNLFLDPAVWKSILPREWRIDIPESLMQVDNKNQKPCSNLAPCAALLVTHPVVEVGRSRDLNSENRLSRRSICALTTA